MRKAECLSLLLLLAAWTSGASVGAAEAQKWRVVERSSYDGCGELGRYDFVLRVPKEESGPAAFTQLLILRGGREVFRLEDKDGLIKVSHGVHSSELVEATKRNLLRSDYVLMLPGPEGGSKCPVLVLFGWGYASDPGSLHVVALDERGVPREVLSLPAFDLSSIKDLDHDGVPEFVGRKCLAQEWGPGLMTYDPLLVYRFGAAPVSPMMLDTVLSRKYNEEHSVGWAGSECREDLAVVLHPPDGGRPRIMPTKEAEALLGGRNHR